MTSRRQSSDVTSQGIVNFWTNFCIRWCFLVSFLKNNGYWLLLWNLSWLSLSFFYWWQVIDTFSLEESISASEIRTSGLIGILLFASWREPKLRKISIDMIYYFISYKLLDWATSTWMKWLFPAIKYWDHTRPICKAWRFFEEHLGEYSEYAIGIGVLIVKQKGIEPFYNNTHIWKSQGMEKDGFLRVEH